MSDSQHLPPEKGVCKHDALKRNSLIVEAHWAAGVRVRCKHCGKCSYVSKRGRILVEKSK